MSYQCIPACASCEREGECTKVWEVLRDIPTRRTRKFQPKAKIEAIENKRGGYVHLPCCGKISTIEDQALYSFWCPKGKDVYCSDHGWQRMPARAKPTPLPEEPMF